GASLQWKYVSLLGTSAEVSSNWFLEGVIKRVGDGTSSYFWFDPWVGGDMRNWLDGEWHWDFRWRRDLSVWDIELLQSLLSVVVNPSLLGATSSWSWRHDSSGTFSVKSAYLMLTGVVPNELDSLLARVWKSWATSKVIIFSWQLLQDRVLTRKNLLRCRVIRDPGDALYAFSGGFDGSARSPAHYLYFSSLVFSL
ncbi:putative ribonuclease H protein, partial [Trifolium medium]|nr:putative ribonuclease H protein [Trifolium medium]